MLLVCSHREIQIGASKSFLLSSSASMHVCMMHTSCFKTCCNSFSFQTKESYPVQRGFCDLRKRITDGQLLVCTVLCWDL